MCGILNNGFCRFSELSYGQFGLTKQLVLRIALPHITLLLASIGYAILGCWILTAIDYTDRSSEAANAIISVKNSLIQSVLNSGAGAPEPREYAEYRSDCARFFADFADRLHKVYEEYPRSPAIMRNIKKREYTMGEPLSNVTWNLFFAATTLTSIGYGVNAPDTLTGRLFCLAYITLGIPLYLVTLADLAKFCTEAMNRAYTEFLKYKYHVRKRFKHWRRNGRNPPHDNADISEVIIAGGEDEIAEFLWTHLENTQFVEVPFLLVYALLLGYIGFATYLIAFMEGWNVQDGFYFVMISVLTIGFGDIVPTKDKYVLITLIVILVGLVVATTCIDIVGAYYIDKLHFFGRRMEFQDPLEWLKDVQQRRIEAMKREAMRRLFEMVTALHHMHIHPPNPPRCLIAYNAAANSVCLKWDPPASLEDGKRFWYTLSYKTRTPHRRNYVTVIDFITSNKHRITGLKSFTLYEFCVVTTTRFGRSKPVRCQEYTEPCTVPQLVRVEAVSTETATISWRAPHMNNGTESYVLMFAQEPAPQFRYWRRYCVGSSKRFTLTDLYPGTRYIVCVLAEHNFGLAAMSKSIRFKTRTWWFDEDYCSAGPIRDRTMDTIPATPQPTPVPADGQFLVPPDPQHRPAEASHADPFAKQLYADRARHLSVKRGNSKKSSVESRSSNNPR